MPHDEPSGAKTVWSGAFAPVDINLDTNLVSASGEYRMADTVLSSVGLKMPVKFDEHGREHLAGLLFESESPRRKRARSSGSGIWIDSTSTEAQQTKSLHGAPPAGNSNPNQPPSGGTANATPAVAQGRTRTKPPLPAKLPRFERASSPDCTHGSLSQPFAGGVTLAGTSAAIVCLPADATTLQAWAGALAAADATTTTQSESEKKVNRLYLEKLVAHSPKKPGPSSYEDLCKKKQ